MACQNQDVVEQIIKLVGERVKMEEQMRTAEGARGSAKNELELLENTLCRMRILVFHPFHVR